MPQIRFTALGPLDLVGAAFSQTLISLVIGMMISFALVVLTSGRGNRYPVGSTTAAASIRSRYRREDRALGLAALAVIVSFGTEALLRGHAFSVIDTVAWWRYATPLVAALVGTGVTLVLILARGTTPPESPVLPAARRTWLSFGPRWRLVGAVLSLLALATTTMVAGLASSPNREGRYVWLVIPVPNEADIDPIRVPFYGWEYGLPVLVCLAALATTGWAALRSNAARPYIRPETVTGEGHARRRVAGAVVSIATAAMLLTLAGAWRLIANAGSVSSLIIGGKNDGSPYDVAWRYAEFAAVAGWCAPVLEITAFVLLLLVTARRLRSVKSEESAAEPHVSDSVVLR